MPKGARSQPTTPFASLRACHPRSHAQRTLGGLGRPSYGRATRRNVATVGRASSPATEELGGAKLIGGGLERPPYRWAERRNGATVGRAPSPATKDPCRSKRVGGGLKAALRTGETAKRRDRRAGVLARRQRTSRGHAGWWRPGKAALRTGEMVRSKGLATGGPKPIRGPRSRRWGCGRRWPGRGGFWARTAVRSRGGRPRCRGRRRH